MPQRDPAVVRAIKAASQRLLAGAPEVVEVGRLSVSALAEEAGVSRNRLNREYQQEREEHVLAVMAAQAPGEPSTERERDLLAQVATLTDEVAALRDRMVEVTRSKDSWKTAAQHFIRAAHLKQVEVNRLKEKDEVARQVRSRLRRELDDAKARAEQAEMEMLTGEASDGSPGVVLDLHAVARRDERQGASEDGSGSE
jgi:hypothetical protein